MVTSCNNTDFGCRARHISIQDHFTEVRSRPEPKAVGILSDLAALFVDLFRMWLSGRGKQTHAFESTFLVLASSFGDFVAFRMLIAFFSQSACLSSFVPSTLLRACPNAMWAGIKPR